MSMQGPPLLISLEDDAPVVAGHAGTQQHPGSRAPAAMAPPLSFEQLMTAAMADQRAGADSPARNPQQCHAASQEGVTCQQQSVPQGLGILCDGEEPAAVAGACGAAGGMSAGIGKSASARRMPFAAITNSGGSPQAKASRCPRPKEQQHAGSQLQYQQQQHQASRLGQ